MTQSDKLPVNFTLSPAAKRAIAELREHWNARSDDPAAVVSVGWGRFMPYESEPFETVVVSFYGESQLPAVSDLVQEVSGMEFVFFTTRRYHPNFEGKVLDFTDDRAFFLRDP